MSTITLHLMAFDGQRTTTTLPLDEWNRLSPVSKVLRLHELARPVLRGQPFSIYGAYRHKEASK